MQLTGHQKADFSNVPFESGFPQGDEQADLFLQGHDVIAALSKPLFYNTRPHYFLEFSYSFHFELKTTCIACVYIFIYTLNIHYLFMPLFFITKSTEYLVRCTVKFKANLSERNSEDMLINAGTNIYGNLVILYTSKCVISLYSVFSKSIFK